MKILELENDLIITQGSLLRTEQVFTSLLFFNGKFLFLSEHLDRLLIGAHFLFPYDQWQNKKSDISDYLFKTIKNLDSKNYYVRLTIFEDKFFVIFKEHVISNETLSLGTAFQKKTTSLRPSYLKLSQYADTKIELQNTKAQDLVYFDNHGYLTEATTSNVFIVNAKNEILTPRSSSMVLEGILRAVIIKRLNALEVDLKEEDLNNAKEIWLTNSIKGMRFVESFNNTTFKKEDSLFDLTLKKLGRFGELTCE